MHPELFPRPLACISIAGDLMKAVDFTARQIPALRPSGENGGRRFAHHIEDRAAVLVTMRKRSTVKLSAEPPLPINKGGIADAAHRWQLVPAGRNGAASMHFSGDEALYITSELRKVLRTCGSRVSLNCAINNGLQQARVELPARPLRNKNKGIAGRAVMSLVRLPEYAATRIWRSSQSRAGRSLSPSRGAQRLEFRRRRWS